MMMMSIKVLMQIILVLKHTIFFVLLENEVWHLWGKHYIVHNTWKQHYGFGKFIIKKMNHGGFHSKINRNRFCIGKKLIKIKFNNEPSSGYVVIVRYRYTNIRTSHHDHSFKVIKNIFAQFFKNYSAFFLSITRITFFKKVTRQTTQFN